MKQDISKFFEWTKRKIFHHHSEISHKFYFREREVWWVAFGKNIGLEIDGKWEKFERPGLIVKCRKDMCFILPLTTQIKSPLPWYQVIINIDGKKSAVNVTQGRSISTKRLLRRAGVLDKSMYQQVLKVFIQQFGGVLK